MARRSRLALAALTCGAVLAPGCGDSDESSDPGSSALGSPELQTSAREADCMDWNRASVEEQQVILDSVAEYEGGEPTGTRGRSLPEQQAREVFDRACEGEHAAAFKLYKVYVRAAAFSEQQ